MREETCEHAHSAAEKRTKKIKTERESTSVGEAVGCARSAAVMRSCRHRRRSRFACSSVFYSLVDTCPRGARCSPTEGAKRGASSTRARARKASAGVRMGERGIYNPARGCN